MMVVSPITTPVPWSMKKLPPILRAGVDVDAARGMGDIGDQARQEGCAKFKCVCQTVVDDRRHARIAEQDFRIAGRCRIALVGRMQVADQQGANVRELGSKRRVISIAVWCRAASLSASSAQTKKSPRRTCSARSVSAVLSVLPTK